MQYHQGLRAGKRETSHNSWQVSPRQTSIYVMNTDHRMHGHYHQSALKCSNLSPILVHEWPSARFLSLTDCLWQIRPNLTPVVNAHLYTHCKDGSATIVTAVEWKIEHDTVCAICRVRTLIGHVSQFRRADLVRRRESNLHVCTNLAATTLNEVGAGTSSEQRCGEDDSLVSLTLS